MRSATCPAESSSYSTSDARTVSNSPPVGGHVDRSDQSSANRSTPKTEPPLPLPLPSPLPPPSSAPPPPPTMSAQLSIARASTSSSMSDRASLLGWPSRAARDARPSPHPRSSTALPPTNEGQFATRRARWSDAGQITSPLPRKDPKASSSADRSANPPPPSRSGERALGGTRMRTGGLPGPREIS